MNSITMQLQADKLIRMALEEDITSEDVSTNAVMPTKVQGTVDLIAKEDGVIAGMDVYARVFKLLDEDTEIEMFCHDGDEVREGDLMAKVTGDIRVLLSGERVALNYLQRMSGIATYTRSVAKLLEGSGVTLLDTRKTTPNCRVFEKYAVRVGGGCNHRYNLSDGVLLKDNHIGAAGSITKAIQMAKAYAPFVRKIEIETETLEQVAEAVEAGADIIMLDNMTPEVMKQAVALIDGRAQTECSGNITKENIARICEIGVDFVSSGALDTFCADPGYFHEASACSVRGAERMKTAERRNAILKLLQNAEEPVAARKLAERYGVSRQVIVQDMAVIRAYTPGIISTTKGYVMEQEPRCVREFKVRHKQSDAAKELNLIVDCGGRVCNISISHRVYGRVSAEMDIRSRQDVAEFIAALNDSQSTVLSTATSGYHYHLVEAASEERLNLIGEQLKAAGFLAPLRPWEQKKGE